MKTAVPVTAARFERIAHELGPCEFVKGEIVPMSPGGFDPSRVVSNIVFILRGWANRAGWGQVLSGEAGFLVGRNPDTVRGADVAAISYRRFAKGRTWSGFVRECPELVVEVLGQKDTWEGMEAKIAEYHEFGVDLVLGADPQTQTVRVQPKSGKIATLHGDDELSAAKLLPGFRCKVREFFET